MMSAEELANIEKSAVYSLNDKTIFQLLDHIAALESDLAASEAAREHDIRVLANQALELERLQGIEARAEADVSNAEAEIEQLKATGVDLVCRLVDVEAENERLREALRENVGEAYNLITQGESPMARRQPSAQCIYDRSKEALAQKEKP